MLNKEIMEDLNALKIYEDNKKLIFSAVDHDNRSEFLEGVGQGVIAGGLILVFISLASKKFL